MKNAKRKGISNSCAMENAKNKPIGTLKRANVIIDGLTLNRQRVLPNFFSNYILIIIKYWCPVKNQSLFLM